MLFATNKQRFDDFSIKLLPFLLDYSKNIITQETMNNLYALAKDCDIEQWREKMFSGERVNSTEVRAVLHTALRDLSFKPLIVQVKIFQQTFKKYLIT